jgi:hypothetical protein
VKLLEGVLHDVFGGGQIAHDQDGKPDQFQVMRPEQLGHVPGWVIRSGVIGSPLRPWPRVPDDIRWISFHSWETLKSPVALRLEPTKFHSADGASRLDGSGAADVDGPGTKQHVRVIGLKGVGDPRTSAADNARSRPGAGRGSQSLDHSRAAMEAWASGGAGGADGEGRQSTMPPMMLRPAASTAGGSS